VLDLSHSRMSQFEQCARHYAFRYVEGREEPPTEATATGRAVHCVLEHFYSKHPRDRDQVGMIQSLQQMEDERYGGMDLDERNLIRYVRVGELADRVFLIEDPSTLDVLWLEMACEVRMHGDIHLRGVIDMLYRDPTGDLVLRDWKTGKPPSKPQVHSKLEQLMLYLWLVPPPLPVRWVELVYLQGTPKHIDPIVWNAEVTKRDMEWAGQRIQAVADAILECEETGTYGPRVGPLCGWCPFVNECPEGTEFVNQRTSK
jgi:putative RecB family exonuclease